MIREGFETPKIGGFSEHYWVTEVSTPDLFAGGRRKLAELWIEPSDMPLFEDDDVIRNLRYLHVPGWQMWFNNGPQYVAPVYSDGPRPLYSPKERVHGTKE